MARSIEEIENDIAMVQKAIDDINARKGQFSPGQIAKMYLLDPKAAEFFSNRQYQQDALQTKETKTGKGIYTPEQKRLLDAKESNRLQMQKAQSSMNQALANKDEDTYNYWKSQVDSMKENDIRLNNMLVETGLEGYSFIEPSKENIDKVDTGAPDVGGAPQTNYDKALQIVNDALAIKNGFTTKDNKAEALSALAEFNARLGAFSLSDNDLAALKQIIDNAKIPPPPKSQSEWVKDFLATLQPKNVIDTARKARALIEVMKDEFKNENYTTANLKAFKEVMGQMSGDEYGIAADSKLAAIASGIPIVGKSFANAIAVAKFNNKEEALARINDAITSYNQLVVNYTAENMVPKEVSEREAKIKELESSGTFAALKSDLGSTIPLLSESGDDVKNSDMNEGKSLLKPVEIDSNDPRLEGLTGLDRARKIREIRQGGK